MSSWKTSSVFFVWYVNVCYISLQNLKETAHEKNMEAISFWKQLLIVCDAMGFNAVTDPETLQFISDSEFILDFHLLNAYSESVLKYIEACQLAFSEA